MDDHELTAFKREKVRIGEEVSSVDVTKLHPPLSETALIQELVAQFLAHDGYVETAKAFTEEVRSKANAFKTGQDTLNDSFDVREDLDAVNRQGKSTFRGGSMASRLTTI